MDPADEKQEKKFPITFSLDERTEVYQLSPLEIYNVEAGKRKQNLFPFNIKDVGKNNLWKRGEGTCKICVEKKTKMLKLGWERISSCRELYTPRTP